MNLIELFRGTRQLMCVQARADFETIVRRTVVSVGCPAWSIDTEVMGALHFIAHMEDLELRAAKMARELLP